MKGLYKLLFGLLLIVPSTGLAAPIKDTGPRGVSSAGKGLQVVLLHGWRDESVNNLVDALVSSSRSRIELNCYPFYLFDSVPNQRLFQATDEPRGRWDNLKYIINKLTNAGKTLVVTIHFSIHADAGDSSAIASNAKSFYSFWNDNKFKDNTKVYFLLSPSLEDQIGNKTSTKDSEYQNLCERIIAKFTYSDLRSGKIGWRRSINPDSSKFKQSRSPSSIIIEEKLTLGGRSSSERYCIATVEHEFHSYINKNYDAYSNDGVVVYSNDEDPKCTKNAETFAANSKIKQRDFDSYSISGGTVLLWRPAYNLYPPIETGTCKEKGFNIVTSTKDKKARFDHDPLKPQFGQREKTVVRCFLGGNC